MTKKIIVGSKNPVKINAVKESFQRVFPKITFETEGIAAPSKVAEQPVGDSETLLGARNRALFCKKSVPSAHYWVGVEGGVDHEIDGMTVFDWLSILAKNSELEGKAKTGTFYLPKIIEKLVSEGIELGEADDKVFEKRNSKQGSGSVGILTHGLINRTQYYKEALILALIPFVNASIYP